MDKKNSQIWEKYYKKLKNKKFWPWTELIRLCKKFVKPKKNIKVLEIGVGNGANIPFFISEGFKFYGIDSSNHVIKYLKKRFPQIKRNLYFGEFENNIIRDEYFDIIVDRGAISCGNNSQKILKIINLAHKNLKKGGIFIGTDWYSKNSTFYKAKKKFGEELITFSSGPFKGAGGINFSSIRNIKFYFKKFKILHLEEINKKNYLSKKKFSTWSIVTKKK